MSARDVERLLDAAPVDPGAEERAWGVVRASYTRRQPLPRAVRVRAALVVPALAVAVAAAALSPPGHAVVNAVRRTIGIDHAASALFRLPAPGRLLVSGAGGTWVVSADGSKRRLGDYPQAAWSPHGLFVVAATADQLAALEPKKGRVHWTVARANIRFPAWGGSRVDTRVAYLSGRRLHVVAGDGTGDAALAGLPAAATVAPAWKPTTADEHELAYVTRRDRLAVVDVDTRRVRWLSTGMYASPKMLAWSRDGTQLALATASRIVVFDARSGRARSVPVQRVRALAFAPDGRLALLRGHALLVLSGGPRLRTVFAAPGALRGLDWSPDGKWLLTALPAADPGVFVQAAAPHRVLGVSNIARQFGGVPALDGWVP